MARKQAGDGGRAAVLLAQVTAHLRSSPGVEQGRMLHSPGLKVHGSFFAFVGTEDELIVKLPRPRAVAAVADGVAEVVTLGTRTLKEWVAFPYPDAEKGPGAWRDAVEEAHAYVASLATSAVDHGS